MVTNAAAIFYQRCSQQRCLVKNTNTIRRRFHQLSTRWTQPGRDCAGGAGDHHTVDHRRDLLCHHDLRQTDSNITVLDAVLVNDTTPTATARKHIKNGRALVYQGNFHNARQLLAAMKRRVEKSFKTNSGNLLTVTQQWKLYRSLHREQARTMNMLLVKIGFHHKLQDLKRAPNVEKVLSCIYPSRHDPYVMPLRELLGMIGAHEWYKKGVFIELLQAYIYPHYGVFAPTRQEYLDLIDQAPTPFVVKNETKECVVMDIGIGTGIISALLLNKQKATRVIGTDINPNAIACARENLTRLGFQEKVDLVQTSLFPKDAKADLIVCNPPWIPGEADSWLDRAVYDDANLSFLQGFLLKAKDNLTANAHAEVWLVLSNMAELLELRTNEELMQMVEAGDLEVIDVLHSKPRHPKTFLKNKKGAIGFEAIAAARAAELTSLYRLRPKLTTVSKAVR